VCGEPYDGAMTDTFRCANCADERLAFDFAIAGTIADGVVRDLVHRFKYQRELQLRAVLAELLARTLADPRIQDWHREAVLVPVPLHPTRKREREYNQAWELCTELARNHGLQRLDALRRLRATTPQASLSRRERQQNLRKAFEVAPEVIRKSALAGRTVLLVDDVLTTGTTASECARILKKTAGVEKVVVITVARG
jgi:competence protein ComFC